MTYYVVQDYYRCYTFTALYSAVCHIRPFLHNLSHTHTCVCTYIVPCSSILISTLYHLYLHMYMNDEHTSIIEHQMSQVTCHLSGYQIGVICQL